MWRGSILDASTQKTATSVKTKWADILCRTLVSCHESRALQLRLVTDSLAGVIGFGVLLGILIFFELHQPMIIQSRFGAAQTGLGYQFYDATGALLSARITAGITALPETGSYIANKIGSNDRRYHTHKIRRFPLSGSVSVNL